MLDIELGRRRIFRSPEAAGGNEDSSSLRANRLRSLRLTTRRQSPAANRDSGPPDTAAGVSRAVEAVRDLGMLLQQNADRVLWACVAFVGLGLAVLWGVG